MAKDGLLIRINGLVQGVGFRPHVWHIAHGCDLTGEVLNDGEGVLIRAFGNTSQLEEFCQCLQRGCPPLARIDHMETSPLPVEEFDDFNIVQSDHSTIKTNIVPDAAMCPECRAEIIDPTNRRYRYPFTNCTHCGPRLSIIKGLPYDRAQTTMAAFKMCPECQKEYEDPADRRFHAQPNACATCGPKVWLEDKNKQKYPASDVLKEAARLLKEGHILAIKGIGGFHLACDACNQEAVSTLRQRKKRPAKPLALMAKDLEQITHFAIFNVREEKALTSSAAPIVLLPAKEKHTLAPSVAPDQKTLGFMLPYTPLHYLLMQELEAPLILTSANLSHEPQVIHNQEAQGKLAHIADFFVMHDRDIENRLDDCVVRDNGQTLHVMRRARGMAPAPIAVPDGFNRDLQVLAMGAELKNTFCLAKDGQLIVSQHMGDQENVLAHQDFRKNIDLYSALHEFTPDVIACDLHPDFLPTKWGQQLAADHDVPIEGVQHHHAHIAAVMGEYGLPKDHPPVLGIVLDGLGLSEDGDIWGGEFLRADYTIGTRLAHIPAIPLLGGEQAMRQPWRNLYAHLVDAIGWDQVNTSYADLPVIQKLTGKNLRLCEQMLEKKLNVPPASSAGRLFDAVAAALDICFDQISYEGEAAILLEQLAEQTSLSCGPYNQTYLTDWSPLWAGLLEDLHKNVDPCLIARKFHKTLASVISQQVNRLSAKHEFDTIALCGGVFQNRLLIKETRAYLEKEGYTLLLPQKFPANDGAISLGQALIACARS
ncbi:carbamoyltransferase HypF [Terasakiella sp. SH-1]|uniref:carbamoyltransferase HypF n=1 Tax=Terasakiella sp. SH-1 TaxID=2560057 RepID=UPI00107449FD|nr:carbamoyltransferase HypF [Terasakiella sp. SH-1]